MHALALRAVLARLGATVAWMLQPPSVTRALADPATLWASAHADLTLRERENAKAQAWRTMVLMAAHLAVAMLLVCFLAATPVEPQLWHILSTTAGWLVVSVAAVRFDLVSYHTVREVNAVVLLLAMVVSMAQRMYGAERVAVMPADGDRFLHVVADHPPSLLIIVLWFSCPTRPRFLASCALLLAAFAYLAPSTPLAALQWDSSAMLFVTGVYAFAGLFGLQWASRSLLDEVPSRCALPSVFSHPRDRRS